MSKIVRIILGLFLSIYSFDAVSQVVYQDLKKTSIYEFLDEMANLQMIELNTAVKPYSRNLIAEKLSQLDAGKLNKRQKAEREFYLKEYNKELYPDKDFNKRYDLFYYKDSMFSITVNPIIGAEFMTNENGNYLTRYSGGEFFGTAGKNFGFYANFRDNVADEVIQNESYLNSNQGEVFKGSGDFSEIKGGLTYGWGWGSIGLIKDRFTFGNNNFGSNISSTKAPSFTRLELKLKPTPWLEFNYYHGFLASEVRDSSRSYIAGARARNVDVRKYIASNLFTITPFKNFNFSIGNSIIYSDNFQPAFLIPFFFFKTIDHAIYSGGGNYGGANTQVFFDVSSRNIKGLHLYSSVFIDEISFSRFWDEDQHSNFVSLKFGAQKSNLFNKNITLTAEYTRTNPITFRHFVNTTTYASNGYNLGHYLRDNAQELAFELNVKPIARLRLAASYIIAQKGTIYDYTGTTTDTDVWGLDFLTDERWESSNINLSAAYELFNDVLFSIGYSYQNNSGEDVLLYHPTYFQGETNTFSIATNIGF